MTLLPFLLAFIASNLMIMSCAVLVYLPLSATLDLGTLGSPSFVKIFTAIPGKFNRSTKATSTQQYRCHLPMAGVSG